MIARPQRLSTTLACAFIGTSTSTLNMPNRNAQIASGAISAERTRMSGKAARSTAKIGPDMPQGHSRAAHSRRQEPGHWHGRDCAGARGEQLQRKHRVGQAEQRLDQGDRDGPGADGESIGEEDRRDSDPRPDDRRVSRRPSVAGRAHIRLPPDYRIHGCPRGQDCALRRTLSLAFLSPALAKAAIDGAAARLRRQAIAIALHLAAEARAGARDAPSRTHSSSFDQRRRPDTLRTAIAMAFFWPTRTTSRLPRVTPV